MNRNLLLVAVALFAWGIGEGAFFYFQPIYLEELGASPIAIGVILSAVGAAMTIVHIPAGHLSDRFGRRRLLWASWLFGMTSTWMMALARSLPVFVIGMILYALTAFVMAPLNSYITAARGKWSVVRAITLISASYNAGAVLGPLLGGWIGDHFGLGRTYLVAASIFVISTAIIFRIQHQPVEPGPDVSGGNQLLENRAFQRFLPIVFLIVFAMYLPQPLTPNFLQNQRDLPLDQAGIVFAAGSLGNVVLNLVIGRMDIRRGFFISHLCVALFALATWKGLGLPWYVSGYFLLGGYRVARSLATAQILDLVTLANMGLAYGAAETVSGIALILGSPLAGYLYDSNPEIIYPLALLMLAGSLLVSSFYIPRLAVRSENRSKACPPEEKDQKPVPGYPETCTERIE
ncbi:MAG: MFS transporter [Chloroflexi bacterium]|nr:MFS transporter [Chloroflexota bacterium]